ncbi:MAG: (2Fe-2S) ferredoxin domain-containing protein [Phycisphaerales bacterium]|nr:(2Fe-2S) ferredoxin domain-containing protein [Phycisphaerales bacterium]
MPKYERHVFICGNERPDGHPRGSCTARGCAAVRDALKAELRAAGLSGRIRTNHAGCLDQCEHGPTIVVYPEQTWYGFVRPEDASEIVREHLVGGRPVERLVLPDSCINAADCPHRRRTEA